MNNDTLTITRHVTIADNGYMVRTEEEGCDPMVIVLPDYTAADILGKEDIEDIRRIADLTISNKIRITITLETEP